MAAPSEAPAVSVYSWNQEKIEQLIVLWEQHPCLFATTSSDYKNKVKKKLAVEQMATDLNTTADEVTKKLRSLRTQYTRERSKLVMACKSGSGVDDVTNLKVTWVHFESLHFLKEYILPKGSRSNMESQVECQVEPNVPDEESQQLSDDADVGLQSAAEQVDNDNEVPVNTKQSTKKPLPGNTGKSKRQKRQSIESAEDDILAKAVKVLEKATSDKPEENASTMDDLFGQYIASELKAVLDPRLKRLMKHKIQNIVFETQMLPPPAFTHPNRPPFPRTGGLDQPTEPFKPAPTQHSEGADSQSAQPCQIIQAPYQLSSPSPLSSCSNPSSEDYSSSYFSL